MAIELIDTHAHIYDDKYTDELSDIIARAKENGVTKVISMGDSIEASELVIKQADEYAELYAAVGIHPENATKLSSSERNYLAELAGSPKVVAIGEIGLDYYWEKDEGQRAVQRQLFVEFLDMARQLHLPVCIHDREAHGDVLKILKNEGKGLTGVLHCFSGSLEMAREVWKMGFLIGIDGPITYKNAAKLPDIVLASPSEMLLVETDSPYLTPVPLRGKRNEPAYVRHVAEKIAEIRGESLEEVAGYTTANAERIYPKLG